MTKMSNLSNELGLLNARVMVRFICMLYQSKGVGPAMLDVSGMLTNLSINRVTSLTNVGSPTRSWDNVNTLHILWVHSIFYKSKGAPDGIKRPKGWSHLMIPYDPHNIVIGPSGKRKMKTKKLILGILLSTRTIGQINRSYGQDQSP